MNEEVGGDRRCWRFTLKLALILLASLGLLSLHRSSPHATVKQTLKKFSNAIVQQNESTSAFSFLQLDEPLQLELSLQPFFNTTDPYSVIIASAIRQEETVAFVVLEKGIRLPGSSKNEALTTLPVGLGCAFTSKKDVNTSALNATSMIDVYAVTQQYYNSSSVWMCDLPDEQVDTSYVSVIIPEWVKIMAGDETFHMAQRFSPHDTTGKINACGKNIYDITNLTGQHVNEYVNYYRGLGVQQFTWYVEQGTKDRISDVTRMLDKHTTKDITFILVPPLFRQIYDPNGPLYMLEGFTVNDCLWRSRAANTNWTLMMFDLDEFLVGTHYLPTVLGNWSYPFLYVNEYLVKYPHVMPRIYRSKRLNISAEALPVWGKSIYRTKEVDVAWVHAPTSPIHEGVPSAPKSLKLLHFRNASRWGFFNEEPEHHWIEIVV